ncbi:MAG: hypothetical protein HGB08_02525 [Candidatus Moranbacteria bacterium]|nr:hypothetical protein [Candidatus Moranbacteria bacterium]
MTDIYMGGEPTESGLFREIKEAAELEKVRTFDEYRSLVDDIIEDKLDKGFLDKNENIEQMKHNLESRWKEIEAESDRIVTTFS